MNLKYKIGDEPVPGFRLEKLLGQGGFGQVWQALAPGGAQVALKLIPLDEPQSYKEIRALSLVKRIRHPNIMPIVGIWLKDAEGNVLDEASSKLTQVEPASDKRGTILVTTREVAARPAQLIAAMGLGDKSLHDRLMECQQQRLTGIPLDELLRYMEDTARALDYLNASQLQLGQGRSAVHHGDIKPKNIMIVGNAAQVGDLGLARVLGDVRSTRLAISAAYAAPESLKGLPPARSTDQYSLAVTYVELRTGELPFEHPDHVSAVMQAHLNGNLDLSRLSLPEQIVIRRATNREPSERFESATDMVIALRDAVRIEGRLSALIESSRRSSSITSTAQIRTPSRFWARVLQASAAACLLAGVGWVGYALQLRTTSVASATTAVRAESASEKVQNAAGPPESPFVLEEESSNPLSEMLTKVGVNLVEEERAEVEVPTVVMDVTNPLARVTESPTRELLLVQAIDSALPMAAEAICEILTKAADAVDSLSLHLDNSDRFSAERPFGDAWTRFQQLAGDGNFEKALAQLDMAIALKPELPWLLTARAELLARMHRADEAIVELQRAIAVDSAYGPAYRQLALVLLGRGDHREASTAATQALLRNARDVEALQCRALAQAHLGNLRTALADYDQAVKIDNERGVLFRLRGVVQLKLRNVEAAVVDLDRAIELDEQDAVARRLRALARLAKGEYQRAIEDRQRTADQAPLLTPTLALRVEQENAQVEVGGKQTKVVKGTPLILEGVAGERLLVKLQIAGKQQEVSILASQVRPFVEF